MMSRAKGKRQPKGNCPPHDFQDDRTRRGVDQGEVIIFHFQSCSKCGRKNAYVERTGRSNGHQ